MVKHLGILFTLDLKILVLLFIFYSRLQNLENAVTKVLAKFLHKSDHCKPEPQNFFNTTGADSYRILSESGMDLEGWG